MSLFYGNLPHSNTAFFRGTWNFQSSGMEKKYIYDNAEPNLASTHISIIFPSGIYTFYLYRRKMAPYRIVLVVKDGQKYRE